MDIIILIIILAILLPLTISVTKRLQSDRDRLELTAEHQRIQRETPEHSDAALGTEEFVLAGVIKRDEERAPKLRSILRSHHSLIIMLSVIYVIALIYDYIF